MTPERAKYILEEYILGLCQDRDPEPCWPNLPVKDVVIHRIDCFDEQHTIKDYTFIGLVKIAYGLYDKAAMQKTTDAEAEARKQRSIERCKDDQL